MGGTYSKHTPTGGTTVAGFDRVTVDPAQMDGAPCIRGLRIPVHVVVSMVAAGHTASEIIEAYPDLEQEDVRQALAYAAAAVRGRPAAA
jgi:uncharacterized protein (DUF433 family)